jgi:HEAT repeat protein
VALLASPLPAARAQARARLVKLGDAAVPALVDALGSWSNEVFNESMVLLVKLGDRAVPALVAALDADELYVRCHAREVLARLGFPGERAALRAALERGLASAEALDRRSAGDALGKLGDRASVPVLRARLDDSDPEVVAACALALAELGDEPSRAAIALALVRASYPETRRDLAWALGLLGSPAGVPALLDGLEAEDELLRQAFFDRFFGLTGLHEGFDAGAPHTDRLEALARLEATWARNGGPEHLLRPPRVAPERHEHAWELVEALGGGTDTVPAGDDAAILPELVALGGDAVPALLEGLSFPPGFATKRARICETLGRIGDARAAPYLVAALRDPSLLTAEWACWALESTGDAAVLPGLDRFEARVRALDRAEQPEEDGPTTVDALLARVARTRFALGDQRARRMLVNLLLSESATARTLAIGALEDAEGERRGYDPNARVEERLRTVTNWNE